MHTRGPEYLGRRNGQISSAGPDTTALPKQKVYSDLKGKIAKKMNIHFGPALVTQDGKQLRIEEIVP